MKRILAVVLILVMTLSVFGGCDKKDNKNPQGTEESRSDGQNTDQQKEKADNADKSDKKAEDGKDAKTEGDSSDAADADSGKKNEGAEQNDKSDNKNDKADASDKKEEKKDAEVPDAGSISADNVDIDEMLAMLPFNKGITSEENDIKDVSLTFNEDGTFEFAQESTLYNNDLTLTINAPAGAKVYYTMDGYTPDSDGTLYSAPVVMEAHGGSFPSAYTFRAVAEMADGTVSKIAARTYIVASKLEGRFSTLIFSVSGNPDELTKKPDGIFTGRNYNQRGMESEREVFVEVWEPDGTGIISQFAGVRIYGGYSRQNSVKSMKLFARKSYDEENKNFKFSDFGTPKLDGSDKTVKKYNKLVLRDCGNDFQFSYIRDELSQTLCKLAGFECYEAVLPAIVYLNGEYYGFFWLHENYSDKYFKEKFGDAEGEFVIAEGSEKKKDSDDDPLVQAAVDEYNTMYNKFIEMDMTDDANFKQVTDFMDVESYLDFFAWNIALNNWDWPNNNYKCYKYVEADAAALKAEGAVQTPDNAVFDGRWRFLVHDMDYSYGLYDQSETQAYFNTLKAVMNKNNNRYAPLFTLLMQRADCRNYFRAKTVEFLNGALSEEVIIEAYKALHSTREQELAYFYEYLEQLSRKGDGSIWSRPEHYNNYEKQIFTFAKGRGRNCLRQMDELLPELEQ